MTRELTETEKAFLEVVDCEPDEILGVPPDRLNAPLTPFQRGVTPEQGRPLTDEEYRGLGSTEVWFGKHRGKALSDLPLDYVVWLLSQQEPLKRSGRQATKAWKRLLKFRDRARLYYEETKRREQTE